MGDKVEIKLGEAGHDTRVFVNGEDISGSLKRIEITSDVNEASQMTAWYACVGGEVNGEMVVYHMCPMGLGEEEE